MFLVDWFYFASFHLIRAVLDVLIVVASPVLMFLYQQKQGWSKNRNKFKTVLITGGSDGLGGGLAQEFAKNENVKTIILTGTNESKLQKIEEICKRSKKSSERKIITKCVNVSNEEEMKSFIDEMDKQHQIDLVIANAGVNISTVKDVYYSNSVRDTVQTNILGVINTIAPMIANFQERKKIGGHIAIVGDIQGYSSVSYNGPYAATKSALRFIADDLRGQCKYWNVGVTFIAPHHIETKMSKEYRVNDNVLSVEQASQHIANGLYNNLPFIIFPQGEFLKSYLKGTIHPYLYRLFVDDKVSQEYAYLHTGRRFAAFGDNDPWH